MAGADGGAVRGCFRTVGNWGFSANGFDPMELSRSCCRAPCLPFGDGPSAQQAVVGRGRRLGCGSGELSKATAGPLNGQRALLDDPRHQPVHGDVQIEVLQDEIDPIV